VDRITRFYFGLLTFPLLFTTEELKNQTEQTFKLLKKMQSVKDLKVNIFRFMGILATGAAAFFLAVMLIAYDWDYFFEVVFPRHRNAIFGFLVSLILAATFFSIEKEEEEKES